MLDLLREERVAEVCRTEDSGEFVFTEKCDQ